MFVGKIPISVEHQPRLSPQLMPFLNFRFWMIRSLEYLEAVAIQNGMGDTTP
jgi:hypothetical protein